MSRRRARYYIEATRWDGERGRWADGTDRIYLDADTVGQAIEAVEQLDDDVEEQTFDIYDRTDDSEPVAVSVDVEA